MEGEENDSFPADVFSDLELKALPRTITGKLRERIDRNDLVVQTAGGDGNCLFRALLEVLKKNQELHMKMRTRLVEEMTEHKDIYMKFALQANRLVSVQPFYDEYLEKMSEEGSWGDLLCILAAANVFHVRVIVICSTDLGLAWEIAPSDHSYKKDVYLSYLYVNRFYAHYNALIPSQEVPAVESRSPSPSDRREFVRWYRVFIGNVPRSLTVDGLRTKARVYGEVLDATIASGEGLAGGIGLVTMADKKSMEDVIEGLNGQIWDGMMVEVHEAKTKGSSPYDYEFSELSIS